MKIHRGALIVVEGLDRTGKSTQCKSLGLNLDWCKSPDVGLPKPDKVFFLTMPHDNIKERNGYGEERYEVTSFQKAVAEKYLTLKENSWDILDANRPVEKIGQEILEKTLIVLNEVVNKPIGKVWVEPFEQFKV